MKKYIFAMMLCASLGIARAQVSLSVHFGGSFPTANTNTNNTTTVDQKGPVFAAYGLQMEFALPVKNLGIAFGAGKNTAANAFVKPSGSTVDNIIHRVMVPVSLQYEMGSNNLYLQLGAGPYYAYALKGKVYDNDTDTKTEAKFMGINRSEFGLGLQSKVVFAQKFSIGLNYNKGLTNTLNDVSNPSGNLYIKNNDLMIHAGFLFPL